MNFNSENRGKTRFDHESTITLQSPKIGVKRDARMYNYSDRGLYFESDDLIEPQTDILVCIANSPFAAEPDKYECYRGLIKWRKSLKRSAYYYGYGVEIIDEKPLAEDLQNQNQYQGLRRHPRKKYSLPVKYKSENQIYEGTTENVSSGGVSIKTQDPVAVGQRISIDIPLKKSGKIKRLTGKVIWSNRKGFGAKFVNNK